MTRSEKHVPGVTPIKARLLERVVKRPGAHALVVRLRWLPPAIGGAAVWPLVILGPRSGDEALEHELVHIRQQERWLVRGLGVGLPLWFFLYLFALPVGWNPWRRRWEAEAYRRDGRSEAEIERILSGPPYRLWGERRRRARGNA
jgi:hypothetical protein